MHCYFALSLILQWTRAGGSGAAAARRRPKTGGRSENFTFVAGELNHDLRPLSRESQLSFLRNFSRGSLAATESEFDHAGSERGASRARSRGSVAATGAVCGGSRRAQSRGSVDYVARTPSSPGGVSFASLKQPRRPQTVGGEVCELDSRPLSRAKTTAGQRRQHPLGHLEGSRQTPPPSKFDGFREGEFRGQRLPSDDDVSETIARMFLPPKFGSSEFDQLLADVHRPSTAEVLSVRMDRLESAPNEGSDGSREVTERTFTNPRTFFGALGSLTSRALLSRDRNTALQSSTAPGLQGLLWPPLLEHKSTDQGQRTRDADFDCGDQRPRRGKRIEENNKEHKKYKNRKHNTRKSKKIKMEKREASKSGPGTSDLFTTLLPFKYPGQLPEYKSTEEIGTQTHPRGLRAFSDEERDGPHFTMYNSKQKTLFFPHASGAAEAKRGEGRGAVGEGPNQLDEEWIRYEDGQRKRHRYRREMREKHGEEEFHSEKRRKDLRDQRRESFRSELAHNYSERQRIRAHNAERIRSEALQIPAGFLNEQGANDLARRRAALDLVRTNEKIIHRFERRALLHWSEWCRVDR